MSTSIEDKARRPQTAHRPVAPPTPGSGVLAVLERAQSLVHRPFSTTYGKLHENHRLEAYCAAFVRWCFKGAGIDLPIVHKVEFYQRFGLGYTGGENTADGLAGNAVGDLVHGAIRGGDIVLYRNTFGTWPYGTITHVGIASMSPGMLYDAGSGSIVHHRSIEHTFNGPVVEVRRLRQFGGAAAAEGYHPDTVPPRVAHHCTRVQLRQGAVSAKLRGKPVRALEILIARDGQVIVNGHVESPDLISAVITDANGKSYKMFKHHGKCAMTDGIGLLWLKLNNGLLEVGQNSVGAKRSNGGSVGNVGIKAVSVEVTIDH